MVRLTRRTSGSGAEPDMTFFCYVYSRGSETPHMEALDSRSLSEAELRSRRMLDEHSAAIRAELFDDDQQVAIISHGETASDAAIT
jgi:hypothetical protein